MQHSSIFQWMSHKKNLFALMGIAASQVVFSPLGASVAGKEALSLRRIAEFWKDGDFEIAKKQILEFLTQYPESAANDHLYAMLGDLYLQEKKFKDAFSSYEKITGEEFKETTLFSRIYCLFQMKDYAGVALLDEPYFKKERDKEEMLEAHFLMGESLVRVALKAHNNEKQKKLAERAYYHYLKLDSSKLQEDFLFPLAETHKLLKNYEAANRTYLSLAEKHPEKKEELLFEAATMQVFIDKNKAIESFATVAELGGRSAKAAAFNQMSLLLETKRYEELLSVYEKRKDVPESKLPLVQLYVGKSHYALNHFQEAKIPLLNYINTQPKNTSQLKGALVCLIHSAQNTKDLQLLNDAIQELKVCFPNDADIAKALLMRSQMAIETQNCKQAIADLQEILKDYPDFGHKEAIFYTSAVLLSQEEKWDESRQGFLTFLEKFPNSSQSISAHRHIVNCSLKIGQKENVISDLRALLNQGLPDEEKREFQFLMAKILYENSQFAPALQELEKYINTYPEHPTTTDAHLLSANCHLKLSSNPEFFVFHAEKVLAKNPSPLLNLHLFNAYLSIGNSQQAALHLYEVFNEGSLPLKWENKLWLADFFIDEAANCECAMKRVEQVFYSLQKTPHDEISLEPLTLKFADLLSHKNRNEEKIALLKDLTEKERANPGLDWKYQRRAILELALTYEKAEQRENAIELYSSLIEDSSHAASYTGLAAMLHRSRLQFQVLSQEQKDENDPALISILENLKELQIKKNIQSEPIHLEAALDYTAIRSSMHPKRALFYMLRVREDFTSEEDIISKDYTTSRKQFAEKDFLFQTYMKYINAEITKLKGETEQAKLELEGLLAEPALNPYLKQRIEKSLAGL